MSYESVKLALTPVAWYRNDEETGTQMADSSGNAHHQTYDPLGTLILGQLSGVETVTASRSVYSDHGITNWEVVLGDDFDSRVTFTWEALVRAADDGTMVIVSRFETNNALLFAGSDPNMVVRFALLIGGVSYSVDSNITVSIGSFYHVIAVRNGGTMFLMINGVVVGSRGDLPASTPITVDTPTDEIGIGGTSHNQTFPWIGLSEEYTFYDYALTSANGLAIYESMVNSLFLHGRSDVIVSATLSSLFESNPVSFPWRHNWAESLVERISFRSALAIARTGAEEANAQRSKPRREVEFTQVLKSNDERRRLRALLWANQANKWFIPLLQ